MCPKCLKTSALCVCEFICPLDTHTHVLILQHPQEPDKELGSARLAHLALPNSTLRIGLSWPNLSKALGRSALQAGRWGVLYLGSGIKEEQPKELQWADHKGNPLAVKPAEIDGIVVLDGTWSQAKTLWWRNAWLLKLKRIILTPKRKSLYRELRREPRHECLATIESIAVTLATLGESPEVEAGLLDIFSKLLQRYRNR